MATATMISLNLIVEIKGYRREDAKEKKSTMDTYWVPGVNHLGTHGRWAFAEFTEVYQIEADFKAKVESEFNKMIESASGRQFNSFTVSINRSEALVRKHFGSGPELVKISEAIWNRMLSSPDHSFHLSDVEPTAHLVSSSIDQTLAVLGLLSSSSAGLLKMNMQSTEGLDVSASEFTQRLSNWWRKKLTTDDEWERWATKISVNWVSAASEGRDQ